MVSEAGHYRTFLALAETYSSKETVRERWKQFLHVEAEIIKNLDPNALRIH